MNIEHIRTFLEVAGTGNFKVAAKRLFVTQSTVSARIRVLEEQLDRPLFARHRHGVSLTEAGRRFQRHAEATVRSWQRARQEATLPEGYRESLGIGAVYHLYDRLLHEWTRRMRESLPHVALRVTVDFSDGLNNALVDGVIDIGVLYQPRDAPGLICEPLMEDELIPVATEPRRGSRDWSEDYIYVDWGTAFNEAHGQAFPNLDASSLYVTLEDLAVKHLLTRGGAAYLSLYTAHPYLESQTFHRITGLPAFKRPSYVVYSESPADEGLMEEALSELRRLVSAVPG